jgi:RimJ/RimL family protein N-acetyltransferase
MLLMFYYVPLQYLCMDTPILIDLPDKVVSDRVLLRPYRSGDGEALFEAVDESREHILPWMPWGPGHQSASDSENLVRTWRARWELREDLAMGMWDQTSGLYLGGTGLHRIDWNVRSFEIGYWIRSSQEGKGYVTAAVQMLARLAFDSLMANRVFIRCASENQRSAAVAKRAGFVFEGKLRNSIRDANGELHDAEVYSLIPSEWAALRDESAGR